MVRTIADLPGTKQNRPVLDGTGRPAPSLAGERSALQKPNRSEERDAGATPPSRVPSYTEAILRSTSPRRLPPCFRATVIARTPRTSGESGDRIGMALASPASPIRYRRMRQGRVRPGLCRRSELRTGTFHPAIRFARTVDGFRPLRWAGVPTGTAIPNLPARHCDLLSRRAPIFSPAAGQCLERRKTR